MTGNCRSIWIGSFRLYHNPASWHDLKEFSIVERDIRARWLDAGYCGRFRHSWKSLGS